MPAFAVRLAQSETVDLRRPRITIGNPETNIARQNMGGARRPVIWTAGSAWERNFRSVRVPSAATPAAISQPGAAGYLGVNQTKFAAMFAVPVDIPVSRPITIRVEPGLYPTNFNQSGQGNFRIGAGPVFRFGKRE